MPSITTKDGTNLFYKDWGTGRPIVFSHGWPLDADAWDAQMLVLGGMGYRVIAHDRRGHGRSDQTWGGNDMNTYADDVAALFEKLDLRDAVFIGHSTGGGEVARYLGRHGTSRVRKAVLMSEPRIKDLSHFALFLPFPCIESRQLTASPCKAKTFEVVDKREKIGSYG